MQKYVKNLTVKYLRTEGKKMILMNLILMKLKPLYINMNYGN